MNMLITFVLVLLSSVILIPCLVLFIECSVAFWFKLPKKENIQPRPSKIAVLIPAHNEADGIALTLNTIMPQLTPSDRLVVIADNCTDETAAIATTNGATVIERHDSEKRGKGYALDFGIKYLASDSPDVVILIDADCIVGEDVIEQLSRQAITTEKPIQALYLMESPPNRDPKGLISSLAFLVKNQVRCTGLAIMGLPCLLGGTGMAFPWSVIQQAPLASGNIVEDMQLGLDLAVMGYAPLFCPQVQVTGRLPSQEAAATGQRKRWEHGHLQTLLSQVPRLLKEGILQRRGDLIALALELGVPPLSLLVVLWIAGFGITLVAALLGLTAIPMIILGVAGLMIIVSILCAWAKFGRDTIPGKALILIPVYLLWKIPLYFAFIGNRQQQWVRTQRTPLSDGKSLK